MKINTKSQKKCPASINLLKSLRRFCIYT